jgi:hypothetical protein
MPSSLKTPKLFCESVLNSPSEFRMDKGKYRQEYAEKPKKFRKLDKLAKRLLIGQVPTQEMNDPRIKGSQMARKWEVCTLFSVFLATAKGEVAVFPSIGRYMCAAYQGMLKEICTLTFNLFPPTVSSMMCRAWPLESGCFSFI